MPTKTKKKTSIPITLPVGTTTSSPEPVSIPTTATPSPTSTIPVALQTVAPPDVNMPIPPTGFEPVNFRDFLGAHPRAGQVAAVPAVLIEIANSATFLETFEPLVPEASHLATDLTNATGWTTLREAIETYLVYVRSEEVITWKQAKSDLEALDAVFQGVAAHNPALLVEFPALTRLLDVQKQIAQKAVSTRVAKAKATASQTTAATPATGATSAPAVNPSTVSGTGGGVTH